MSTKTLRKTKVSTRINLRVDADIKATLVRAAKLQRLELTEFMLNSSQAAAEIALADRAHFALTPDEWKAFNDALDKPPKYIPALRRLFREEPATA